MWNGPTVLAIPIVEVEVVSPITAWTVDNLRQVFVPCVCLFIRAKDALIERGTLGQES